VPPHVSPPSSAICLMYVGSCDTSGSSGNTNEPSITKTVLFSNDVCELKSWNRQYEKSGNAESSGINEVLSLWEFAFVLPLLAILLMGGVEFGRAFYTYNILTKISAERRKIPLSRIHLIDRSHPTSGSEQYQKSGRIRKCRWYREPR